MLPAARAADPPPKLDSVLKGMEDRYNKTKTVQVDFVQTYTDRARKTTEKGQEDRREALELADRGAKRFPSASPTPSRDGGIGRFLHCCSAADCAEARWSTCG